MLVLEQGLLVLRARQRSVLTCQFLLFVGEVFCPSWRAARSADMKFVPERTYSHRELEFILGPRPD